MSCLREDNAALMVVKHIEECSRHAMNAGVKSIKPRLSLVSGKLDRSWRTFPNQHFLTCPATRVPPATGCSTA
ncbi:Uncharacterised protein [Mycobacteroides abscessus subsp. abscessus]|nr:Uncharacterised protein [Mycobacteroides abscessus subsp. abscessus]